MYCPICGNQLQTLSVTTIAGGRFDVEHCGRCGGTWFDPFEINRIPYHEVTRLAKLTVLPHQPPSVLKTNLCPRCHEELQAADFDVSPSKITMKKCPKCKGIWASQRQLEELVKEEDVQMASYKTSTSVFPSFSVGFLPVIFFFLFVASTFLTIKSVNDTKSSAVQAEAKISQLKINPYTSNAVTIVFQTSEPVITEIEFGPSRLELATKPISASPKSVHGIIINNLEKGKNYLYRITLIDSAGRKYTTGLKIFTPSL